MPAKRESKLMHESNHCCSIAEMPLLKLIVVFNILYFESVVAECILICKTWVVDHDIGFLSQSYDQHVSCMKPYPL